MRLGEAQAVFILVLVWTATKCSSHPVKRQDKRQLIDPVLREGWARQPWHCSESSALNFTVKHLISQHMTAHVKRLELVSACKAGPTCPAWWQQREREWRKQAVLAEHLRLCTHAALFGDFLPTSRLRLKQALEKNLVGRYTGVYTPHDYWEPAYSCLSDSRIPVKVGDGPKWVCGVDKLPRPCRLVSLGSNFDDSFERAVYDRAGCAAYIIDPTLGKQGVVSSVVRGESVAAFEARLALYGATLNGSVGVGNPATKDAPFRIVAMAALLRDHYGSPPWRLDLLKVDVEGAELPVLREVFALCEQGLLHVGQLNVEMHTSPAWYPHSFRKLSEIHAVFMEALSCGLLLHHKERNLWGCRESECLEYAWVSIAHARREAALVLTPTEIQAAPTSSTVEELHKDAAQPMLMSGSGTKGRRTGTDGTQAKGSSSQGDSNALFRMLDEASLNQKPGQQPYVILQVMHGLGNRLRALVSAISFTPTLGRRLAVVWEPDIHCNARFSDLFLPLAGIPVFDGLNASSDGLARLAARSDTTIIRLTSGDLAAVDKQRNLQKHVYVQASFRIVTARQIGLPRPAGSKPFKEMQMQEANFRICMRRLQPVSDVLAMVRDLRARVLGNASLGSGLWPPIHHDPLLAIHVRSLANLSLDIPSIDQHESDTTINKQAMRGMPEARQRCAWQHFLAPATTMLATLVALPPLAVYVSADTPDGASLLCQELRRRRGDTGLQCAGAPDDIRQRCDGSARRGVYCQKVALAEMIMLAQAKALLYSDKSSFSEVAATMSADLQTLQSGCLKAPLEANSRR